MENPHVIYKFTNLINGKGYIGQTMHFKERMRQHLTTSWCTALHGAILKYGINNFNISIVEKDIPRHLVDDLEKKYMIEHNTLVPNGYNLVLEDSRCRIFTDEVRKRMSKGNQGKGQGLKNKNGYLGVTFFKSRKAYRARIGKDNKSFCRYYRTLNEACEAYDKVAISLFGRDAKINKPEKLEEYLKGDLSKFAEDFCYCRIDSSKFIGVSFHKPTGKWASYIYDTNKKQLYLGVQDTENEAALLRDQMKMYLTKDSGHKYNFPDLIKDLPLLFCENLYKELTVKTKINYEWTTKKD